jgi:hypothetical protein
VLVHLFRVDGNESRSPTLPGSIYSGSPLWLTLAAIIGKQVCAGGVIERVSID